LTVTTLCALVSVPLPAARPSLPSFPARRSSDLPETLGSGCVFLDYDRDRWQDILLINGMDWPGHKRQRTTLRLYRNNRNGTFTEDRKSTRLNSSHQIISYAVFCLKKKKQPS